MLVMPDRAEDDRLCRADRPQRAGRERFAARAAGETIGAVQLVRRRDRLIPCGTIVFQPITMSRPHAAPVPPERVPEWVPGKLLLDSKQRFTLNDTLIRSYRYAASAVQVPALRDYAIVAITKGETQMCRKVGGPWQSRTTRPGYISLLSREEECDWNWSGEIEVLHLYLTSERLRRICRNAFDREIDELELRDLLNVDDLVLYEGIRAIAHEASTHNLGGELYVDSIVTQICLHLLRNYADISLSKPTDEQKGLSYSQARRVSEFIHTNLSQQLLLEDLAEVINASTSYFLRQFKAHFGATPHAYVMRARVEHARSLLAQTSLPIKDVAARSGFSDQAHLTRIFQRLLDITPNQFRLQSQR